MGVVGWRPLVVGDVAEQRDRPRQLRRQVGDCLVGIIDARPDVPHRQQDRRLRRIGREGPQGRGNMPGPDPGGDHERDAPGDGREGGHESAARSRLHRPITLNR